MTQVNLDEAKEQLGELVEAALNGEEVQITRNGHSVRLVPCEEKPNDVPASPRPRFGSAKGIITYMADDFDAPLDDFKEYME
jgi:prevent-host-death family protein